MNTFFMNLIIDIKIIGKAVINQLIEYAYWYLLIFNDTLIFNLLKKFEKLFCLIKLNNSQ